MSINVPPHPPVVEEVASLLLGIETVPPAEARKMVNRAVKAAHAHVAAWESLAEARLVSPIGRESR